MSQNYELSHDRTLKYLQIEVESASREYSRARMPLAATHRNAFGVAHGGIIAALIDTAFGVAANAGSEHPVVTMSLSVNFLRPGANGPLTAEARLTHGGGHILSYNITVLDADKELVATAMACGYITSEPLPDSMQNSQGSPKS